MVEMKEIKEKLLNCLGSHIDTKGLSKMDVNEVGEVVDMIKDMAEAEYYCSIVKAMEEEKEKEKLMPERMYYSDRMSYMPVRFYSASKMPMPIYDDYMMPYTGQIGGQMGNRNSNNYMPSKSNIMSRMGFESDMNNNYNQDMESPYMGQIMPSKYGYSHDEYMTKMDMFDQHADKEQRRQVITDKLKDVSDMLTDTMEKMTPEEKQMWKQRLNKVINL